MILERRQSWPALAIMCVGLLTLSITLKAAQQDMPVQPQWLLGALAGLYVVLAGLAEGLTWRAAVLLGAMLAAHALMALLMGWGYAAVEGEPRALAAALQHGTWDYLPGTALQFGFACLTGIVLDVWLEPLEEEEGEEAEEVEAEAEAAPGPDLSAAADMAAGLELAVGVPGVAGALYAAGESLAAGVWARDPQAALQRVQAVVTRSGAGLNSLPLEAVSLLTRSEEGRVAALLVTPEIEQPAAHDLLRQLWAIGQRGAEQTEQGSE
jgi:hypothetical protein